MEDFKHSTEKAKDTGLAIARTLLLVSFLGKRGDIILPAIIMLVAVMTWPRLLTPPATVWFKVYHAPVVMLRIFTPALVCLPGGCSSIVRCHSCRCVHLL